MSLCVGVSVYMKKRKYNCVYNTTREYQRLYVEIEEQHQYPHIFRSVCVGVLRTLNNQNGVSRYTSTCVLCVCIGVCLNTLLLLSVTMFMRVLQCTQTHYKLLYMSHSLYLYK